MFFSLLRRALFLDSQRATPVQPDYIDAVLAQANRTILRDLELMEQRAIVRHRKALAELRQDND